MFGARENCWMCVYLAVYSIGMGCRLHLLKYIYKPNICVHMEAGSRFIRLHFICCHFKYTRIYSIIMRNDLRSAHLFSPEILMIQLFRYSTLTNIHKLQVEHLSNLSYALRIWKHKTNHSHFAHWSVMEKLRYSSSNILSISTEQSCQRLSDINTNSFRWENTTKFNEPNVELFNFNGHTERPLSNEILHPKDIILEFLIKFMTAQRWAAMWTDCIQQRPTVVYQSVSVESILKHCRIIIDIT